MLLFATQLKFIASPVRNPSAPFRFCLYAFFWKRKSGTEPRRSICFVPILR
jgi:hypothetical protein